MRKTKRLLILSVLLIALTLSFSTAALASGEDVIPDDAVAIVEFFNYNTEDYYTRYYTADQLAGGTIFGNEYSSDPYVYVTSITLLNNLTVEVRDLGNGVYIGWLNFCRNDVPWELNLGGYTLTFKMPSTVQTNTPAVCIYTFSEVSIANGTIAANVVGSGFNADFSIYGATVFGLAKWESEIVHTFSNVEIISTDPNAVPTSCFTVMESPSSPGNVNTNVKLENCVVDLGASTNLFNRDNSQDNDSNIFNIGGEAQIVSGSYTGLDLTGKSDVTEVNLEDDSKKLETNPLGVDENTTVIVSDDTTAIIVDDGNAYLYDTLQDAVDDAAKRTDEEGAVTIHLLKQPSDAKVELPSGVDTESITLSKLNDSGSINYGDIVMSDSTGKPVTVNKDGTLSTTIAVTGVTLDKTSLDLTVGDSAMLTATVTPENATNKDVTWSSDKPEVATVDSTGKVTALKPGTATITATAGGKSATCTVTVSREPVIPDPNGITVTQPANGTIKVNPSNGSAGTLITVTATPDKGYELAYITVDGEKISGNTFRMPDKAVTVSAVFVPMTFPFVDVKTGDWFYDYVVYVYSNGLMDGTSATTFEPNANMTRAMVWTILARIDGETVTGSAWADTARAWAMSEGVSDGTDPNGLVTREQFATMLYRYAVAKGYDVSIGESTNILSYADYDEISEWAIPAMQWACGSGIITGVTESTLVPQGTATRAQCAAMLMRFAEL